MHTKSSSLSSPSPFTKEVYLRLIEESENLIKNKLPLTSSHIKALLIKELLTVKSRDEFNYT